MLWRVAKVLKAKRHTGGSLRIDMPKLQFSLDPETKMPQGASSLDEVTLKCYSPVQVAVSSRRSQQTI